MRRWCGLRLSPIIALLFFLLLAAVAQQTYFPKKAFGGSDARSDELLAGWFSHELKVLKEPSLLELAKDGHSESYRFLWLRTFHHPIAVRLDVKPDGTGNLTTKVGSGHAGFPRTGGQVVENVSRSLTHEQTGAFLAKVDELRFWSVPSHIQGDQTGTDGSEWIIEGAKAGKYHVAARWSPDSPPPPNKRAVRELGLALAIELAQMNIPEDEIY
jgi:hypothetical protein